MNKHTNAILEINPAGTHAKITSSKGDTVEDGMAITQSQFTFRDIRFQLSPDQTSFIDTRTNNPTWIRYSSSDPLMGKEKAQSKRLPRNVIDFFKMKWGTGGNMFSFEDDGTGSSDLGGEFTWTFEEPDIIRLSHSGTRNTASFKIGTKVEDSVLLYLRGEPFTGKTVNQPKE